MAAPLNPALQGVIFCEFDNQKGRTLAFQAPQNAISDDTFDAISDYLIPKPQLCGQLMHLRTASHGSTVVCWPVCVEDARYERNALIFSLGFVLDAHAVTEHDVCERYGHVLRKACAHLAALERESADAAEGVFEEQQQQQLDGLDEQPPLRSRLELSATGELAHLLPQIWEGLRMCGVCEVAADAANTLMLQLPPKRVSGPSARFLELEGKQQQQQQPPSPSAPTGRCHELGSHGHDYGEVVAAPPSSSYSSASVVADHLVPLLVADLGGVGVAALRGWDLLLQTLLRWIDGTRDVSEIAAAARAEVRRCDTHVPSYEQREAQRTESRRLTRSLSPVRNRSHAFTPSSHSITALPSPLRPTGVAGAAGAHRVADCRMG